MVRIPFDTTNGVQNFLKTNVTSFDKDAQGAKDDVSIPFGNELDITDEENERIKRGEHLVPWRRQEEGSEHWAHALDRLYQPQLKQQTIQDAFDLASAHFRDHTLRFPVRHIINTLNPNAPKDEDFHVTEEDAEGYEDFPQIMQARSYPELLQYKAIADDIRRARKIKSEHGFVANLVAGSVFDPVAVATGIVGGGIANAGFKLLKVAPRLVGVGGAVVKGATGASVAAGLDMTVRSIGDETPSARDYAIGISSAGIIGGIISAAPHLWNSATLAHKRKMIESAQSLSKELKTPEATVSAGANSPVAQPSPMVEPQEITQVGESLSGAFVNNGNYKIAGAFGAENFAMGSPDIKLAGSSFETAREAGRKLSPFSFAIEENGVRVAQGATVEMLANDAIAVDLDNFIKKTQSIFKEWLDSSTDYNWCSKKFTSWSSFNLYQGKAYDEFQSQFKHALFNPAEQCAPAIAKMRDFWISSSKAITDKAVKAGVFNESFNALKKTWESERTALNNQKLAYEKAVKETENILNDGLRIQSEVESEIGLTDSMIAEEEKKIERAKKMIKENRSTLQEVGKEMRSAANSLERARDAKNVRFGERKEAVRTYDTEAKAKEQYLEKEAQPKGDVAKISNELTKLQQDTLGRVMSRRDKLLEISEKFQGKKGIVKALTLRLSKRKHIHEALRNAIEIYEENVSDFKNKKRELENISTQMRHIVKNQHETLKNLRKLSLTKEQSERLVYLNKRLSENKFSIEDISNIKDLIYAPRIYVRNLFKSPSWFSRIFGRRKIKDAQNRFMDALVRAYQEGGDTRPYEELRASAYRTLSKIQGEHLSRARNPRKLRGAELRREVDIPSRYIEEFIEGDPLRLYYSLVRTFEPDIALMKAFGTLNENDILAKLEEERGAKAATASTDEEFNSIKKDYEIAKDTLSLLWGRIRGTRAIGSDNELLHFFKTWNVLTKLGKTSLTTIYNLASAQQHVGLTAFLRNAVKITSGKILFSDVRNANLWIRAIDATQKNRITDLANALSHNKLDAFASLFMKTTMLDTIDGQFKEMVGYTALERIIETGQKVKAGHVLSKKSREQLVSLGVSDEMLLSIANEFEMHGKVLRNGVYDANIEAWGNEEARDALVSAVRKKQNEGVLVPTAGTTPAIFDNAYASTALQFKRCLASSVSKNALPLLQDARAGKLSKVTATLGVSAIAFYLREIASDFVSGKKNRTDEQRIESAVQNMDVLSWGGFLLELSQTYRDALKNPNYGTSRLIGQIGGPSVGTLKDFVYATSGVAVKISDKELNYQQRAAIRRLLPLNNLIWWSWVWDNLVGEPEEKKQRRKNFVSYFE